MKRPLRRIVMELRRQNTLKEFYTLKEKFPVDETARHFENIRKELKKIKIDWRQLDPSVKYAADYLTAIGRLHRANAKELKSSFRLGADSLNPELNPQLADMFNTRIYLEGLLAKIHSRDMRLKRLRLRQ